MACFIESKKYFNFDKGVSLLPKYKHTYRDDGVSHKSSNGHHVNLETKLSKFNHEPICSILFNLS